jgi:ribulose-phosphate 3-epimerase
VHVAGRLGVEADVVGAGLGEGLGQRIDATGKDIRLEVDGGIKTDNIARVASAGADTFVAGSAIFGKPDYKGVIDAMRKELAR